MTSIRKNILNVLVVFVRISIMFFDQTRFALDLLKSNMTENKKLTNSLNSLFIDKKFKVYEIVMPGVLYAFTIGGKSIYITSDYLKMFTEREQLSLLLHEVGHLVGGHSLKAILTIYPLYILYLYFGVMIGKETTIIGILTTIILMILTSTIYSRFIKRRYESNADRFTTRFGYGLSFITLLKKKEHLKEQAFLKNKMSIFYKIREKYRYYVGCYLPTEKRIANILDGHEEFVKIKKQINKKRISTKSE